MLRMQSKLPIVWVDTKIIVLRSYSRRRKKSMKSMWPLLVMMLEKSSWLAALRTLVMVTPRTLSEVTRGIPGIGGDAATRRFLLMSTNTISVDFFRFNVKLFLSSHVST